MDEVTKKTITVKVDQHEAIVRMKRGKDTLYDVVDRLIDSTIENDDNITHLETAMEDLEYSVLNMVEAFEELKMEMMKCSSGC